MGRKVLGGANGRHGRLFIAGQEFCVTSWNVSETADEEDTTNSCSAGFAEQEYGVAQLEGSLEADWDITASPMRTPPNVKAGSNHPDTYLFINAETGALNELLIGGSPFYSMTMRINNVAVTNPARGKVTYSFDFKSQGSYKLPTESMSSGA